MEQRDGTGTSVRAGCSPRGLLCYVHFFFYNMQFHSLRLPGTNFIILRSYMMGLGIYSISRF